MSSASAARMDPFGQSAKPLESGSEPLDRRSSPASSDGAVVKGPSARDNDWPPEITDGALIEGVCRGDPEALRLLFRRYARIVRAVAVRIVRDSFEADDVVQEVFLFVFRKAALFDNGKGSVRSWLLQVAHHRAIDRRRHLASRHFYTGVEVEDEILEPCGVRLETAFSENKLEGVLGKEVLRRVAESLSPDQHVVIQLHFFEGYTMGEIATIVGQTVGNIRNHYYRALERIRKEVFKPTVEETQRDRNRRERTWLGGKTGFVKQRASDPRLRVVEPRPVHRTCAEK